MYGAIPFYQACCKYEVKPLIGLELLVEGEHEADSGLIRLLAKNNQGYKNLLKLATKIKMNDEAPALKKEEVWPFVKNCLLIFPYRLSPLARVIEAGTEPEAEQALRQWLNRAERTDCYMELQGDPDYQAKPMKKIRAFAKRYELQTIVSNPVRFLHRSDYESYLVVQAIQKGETLQMVKEAFHEQESYLQAPAELTEKFSRYQSELEATAAIADRCRIELELGKPHIPAFPLPPEQSPGEKLRELCLAGINERYQEPGEALLARLDYELDVIKTMGFSDYFLIVWDFVSFARKQAILIGPGRGSAAGSLVAYLLGITNVDPLKYDLLFERFFESGTRLFARY